VLGAFADARLTPFADMAAHWKNDGAYRACVARSVAGLIHDGLYDPRFLGDVLSPDAPRPSDPTP
jgi:hypothetical protein